MSTGLCSPRLAENALSGDAPHFAPAASSPATPSTETPANLALMQAAASMPERTAASKPGLRWEQKSPA
eukprot:scaffold60075_cov31-Tisochrysis_lutea.AAC.3